MKMKTALKMETGEIAKRASRPSDTNRIGRIDRFDETMTS